jgi:hypothetical protein
LSIDSNLFLYLFKKLNYLKCCEIYGSKKSMTKNLIFSPFVVVGSGIEKVQDLGSGTNNPDPQHGESKNMLDRL